jgi:hypothetical protein
VVQGITNSAMRQQMTAPPHKGLFPDSWEMATNLPNVPFLNPGLIMVNEWRLRGLSAEVRHQWLGEGASRASLNAGVEIQGAAGSVETGRVRFTLCGSPGLSAHASLAPVPEPRAVSGCGDRAGDGAALLTRDAGWEYDPDLRAVVLKAAPAAGGTTVEVVW